MLWPLFYILVVSYPRSAPTLPKLHYPLSRTKLTSLVKGEMLSPVRIAFLPHPFRFSDTSVNNPSIVGSASHCNRSSPLHKGAKGDSALPTIPKPHYPSKIANTLASLVKGRWIDGKAQTVALLRLLAVYPPFYTTSFSAVKTEGLSRQPSPVSIPPKPHYPSKSTIV